LVLAFWVEPEPAGHPLVAADPSDDAYLLASAESEADYLVSGDHHLLALREFETTAIISPREFLERLR
jgi:predicted nucleic acid-binding protein